MTDKRFCGVCATKGHASAECPRVIGIGRSQHVIERELTGDTITLTVDDGTRYVAEPTEDGIVWHGVTENTPTVTKKRRGRPNKSNTLTNAAKQRAYRERNRA